MSTCEIEKGRALALQVEIMGLSFVFINIYAPNNGADRIRFFRKVNESLKDFDKGTILVLGGDWNCTLDFTVDRNGEEPCPPSASVLRNIIRDYDLIDVWREHHPMTRQYTWVKVASDHVSSARLDRFILVEVRIIVFKNLLFPQMVLQTTIQELIFRCVVFLSSLYHERFGNPG